MVMVMIMSVPPLPATWSAGHTLIVLAKGLGDYVRIGSSLDDNIGEAFDKTARLLGITAIPGGPALERLAAESADPSRLGGKPSSPFQTLNPCPGSGRSTYYKYWISI